MATRQTTMTFNGRWMLLLKFVLVLVPVVCVTAIPWVQWQTENAYATEALMDSCTELRATVKAQSEVIASLPQPDWKDRTLQLEQDMRRNASDHTEIKMLLAEIKAKLVNKP